MEKYFIRTFSLFIIALAQCMQTNAQEEVHNLTVQEPINTYASTHTTGKSISESLQTRLNPGDEVQVNGVSADGKSVHVTATSGLSEGNSSWFSFHDFFNGLSADNNTTPNKVSSTTSMSGSHLNNQFQKSFPHAVQQHISRKQFKPASDDDVWNGAVGENPKYKVDTKNYNGGDYIPFYQETHDEFGSPIRTRHYVRADPAKVVKLHQGAVDAITGAQKGYCQSGIYKTYTAPKRDGDWVPGCEVLQNVNLANDHKEKLYTCISNIKEAIGVNGKSRSALFKNLYSKLNSREQEFAAMIFTTVGEARSENHADQVMVMKVINNRARYAQDKGFSRANELDVVLQNAQFSMYNSNDPNWKLALTNPPKSSLHKAIDSYLLYRNTSFGEGNTANVIYHYHTRSMGKAMWSHQGKVQDIRPNGDQPSEHIFYSGVPWTFRFNNYRS